MRQLILGLFSLIFVSTIALAEPENSAINWVGWSDGFFAQAKSENKLVLLNLEAVWCHWCHVMAKETYSDPEIQKLLTDKFITLKVDQDARPDLSNRYRDWGWPATIIFRNDGTELAKLAGYVEKDELKKIIKQLIEKPEPIEVEAAAGDSLLPDKAELSQEMRDKLTANHYDSADFEIGGLKTSHRYLDPDTVENALTLAKGGSERDVKIYQLTLNSELKLIDPVWGGAYQYSTYSNWDSPHFEKIMPTQANNITLYSEGYALSGEAKYLKAATDVQRFIKDFLTAPDGSFYTSQDADVKRGEHSDGYFKLSDVERRKIGIPAIDQNVYARENGLMIAALAALYEASGNEAALNSAQTAAGVIERTRKNPDGSFSHDGHDQFGPFLADTLNMGVAELALYRATADRARLKSAREAADAIRKLFVDEKNPGLITAAKRSGDLLPPVRITDENIRAARFFNMLSHYTGEASYQDVTRSALRWLAQPRVAYENRTEPGILIVERELRSPPLHLTVVGAKNDPAAQKLFQECLRYFAVYKRLEWADKTEGPMPNPDVTYPPFPKAAAYVCSNKRCSIPIFEPADVKTTIEKILKRGQA